MDIVIVSQYLRDIECFESNNSRFVYIAKLLAMSKNNNVEIITSDYNHTKKEKFNKIGKLDGVKITACHYHIYRSGIYESVGKRVRREDFPGRVCRSNQSH